MERETAKVELPATDEGELVIVAVSVVRFEEVPYTNKILEVEAPLALTEPLRVTVPPSSVAATVATKGGAETVND